MKSQLVIALRPKLSRATKAKRDMERLASQLERAKKAGDQPLIDRLERHIAFMTVNYL